MIRCSSGNEISGFALVAISGQPFEILKALSEVEGLSAISKNHERIMHRAGFRNLV